MDLHDMKRTKEEKKEYSGDAPVAVDSVGVDDYPYGLEISLEKESLEKLGIDIDDFAIGGTVEMICQAEVVRLHESASKRDTNASASIQITKMAMLVKPNFKKVTLKDVMDTVKGS